MLQRVKGFDFAAGWRMVFYLFILIFCFFSGILFLFSPLFIFFLNGFRWLMVDGWLRATTGHESLLNFVCDP